MTLTEQITSEEELGEPSTQLTEDKVIDYVNKYFTWMLDDPKKRDTLVKQALHDLSITEDETDKDKTQISEWGLPVSELALHRRLDNLLDWDHEGLNAFDKPRVTSSNGKNLVHSTSRIAYHSNTNNRHVSIEFAETGGGSKKGKKKFETPSYTMDEPEFDREIEALRHHFNNTDWNNNNGNGNGNGNGRKPTGLSELDEIMTRSAIKDVRLMEINIPSAISVVKQLETVLPKKQWEYLLGYVGGIPKLIESIDGLNITALPDKSQLVGRLGTMMNLPAHAWETQEELFKFNDGEVKQLPFNHIDDVTSLVIGELLRRENDRGTFKNGGASAHLRNNGYTPLEKLIGGATKLIDETKPDLVTKIPHLILGKLGKDRYENIVLDSIIKALHTIPGYKEAEKQGREAQIKTINDFIKENPALSDYFQSKGLDRLMENYYDSTGVNGFKRKKSARAVLEFYSDKYNLNWLDRTQDTYIHTWRIQEQPMWSRDEKGKKRALEAIADALYQIDGYRDAERAGNRDEQVGIITKFIKETKSLTDFFIHEDRGLSSLISHFYDPTGDYGLTKKKSARALLEFYSTHQTGIDGKPLDWFNRDKDTYIPRRLIRENRMWQNGQKSAELANEFITDALYNLLPGYKEAYKEGNRDEIVRLIYKGIKSLTLTRENLKKEGLGWMMDTFRGEYGLKNGSVHSMMEFYSNYNNLGLFDETRPPYRIMGKNRAAALIDPDGVIDDVIILEEEGMPISAFDTTGGIERMFYRKRDDLTNGDIKIVADYVSIARGTEHNDLTATNLPIVDLIRNALLREIKEYNSADSHDHILNRKESCLSGLENNIIELCSSVLQQIKDYNLRDNNHENSYSSMVHAAMAEAERHRFVTNPYSSQTEILRIDETVIPDDERTELINTAEAWYNHYFDAADLIENENPMKCAHYLNFACDAAKQASLLSKKSDNTWKKNAYNTAMDAYDIIEREIEKTTQINEKEKLVNFAADCLYKAGTMAWIICESNRNDVTALDNAKIAFNKYSDLLEKYQLDRDNISEIKHRQAILQKYAQIG